MRAALRRAQGRWFGPRRRVVIEFTPEVYRQACDLAAEGSMNLSTLCNVAVRLYADVKSGRLVIAKGRRD